MALHTNRILRIARHLFRWPGEAARRFHGPMMDRIEQRIAEGERHHGAEIRIAIEAGLPASAIWAGRSARERALEVFGALRVWDTEANNGVLIYLLLADHAVELIADRGAHARVDPDVWRLACEALAPACREGREEQGLIGAIEILERGLTQAYPAQPRNPDELPNRPTLL